MRWPRTWPKWVKEILDEMAQAEGRAVESSIFRRAPAWVSDMGLELMKLGLPGMQITKMSQSGPYYLGRLLGHFRMLLADDGPLVKKFETISSGVSPVGSKKSRKRRSRAEIQNEREQRSICRAFVRAAIAKERALRKAQAVVTTVPLEEAQDFHRGYCDGLASEVHWEQTDLVLTPLPIYFLMVFNWPVVKKLPSTYALYKLLCAVLGAPHVRNYDRVKKICQRYGVRLRRPGRPRKKRK